MRMCILNVGLSKLGLSALCLSACLMGAGLRAQTPRAEGAGQSLPSTGPLAQLPYSPGLDVESMDPSVDACEDFYQYSCGGWIRKNPIPEDQPAWSVYAKLYEDNQRFLWGILADLAGHPDERSPAQLQLGRYFSACMDDAALEAAGAKPLAPALAAIDQLANKAALPALIAQLQTDYGTNEFFFGFASTPDFADAARVIAEAAGGGLGLPDRDYYLKNDPKSRELRTAYRAHVARLFGLLGVAPGEAGRAAERVLAIESRLARASLSSVERRDPYKVYHKMGVRELAALTPRFDWSEYLKARGLAGLTGLNVAQPRFYRAFNQELLSESLPDIRTYLRWHLVHAAAQYLSVAFVNEDFAFFGTTLNGTPTLAPRWKRCVQLTDRQLGESLGEEFARRAFTPELRERTQHMTVQIEHAMQLELEHLDWMTPATRTRALEKLHAIVNKIGYPDRPRDYSSIEVSPADFFGNVRRATRFESRRDIMKVGRPLDRQEWYMTAPSVNAYYDSSMNDINFPAGILEPPLYDPHMDDAPNYGNTGGTIGHELTHGFDDEGRKFDAHGNLKDWWTREDARAFEKRAQCVVDQYARYTVVDDVRINSKLTEGEDIADLGGLVLAWLAWHLEEAGKSAEARDGLTPEQRFFVGYAQWACEDARPEFKRAQAIGDPHSPGRYRVNGLVVNMPEFARAFSCRPHQAMVKAEPCRIW